MTNEQRLKNMTPDASLKLDAVLDTDAYNEIDDQFAIAYMLRSKERFNVRALYAAPFHNEKSDSFGDGMKRSYREIHKILDLMGEEEMKSRVYEGSEQRLPDEHTPVISPAALDLAQRAKEYSPEHPLYVIAIGAITNVASALLIAPEISENIVVVWLGSNAHHYPNTREFNLLGDIAAARVVMKSGAPYVQLSCMGVVSAFTVSEPELRFWLGGKSALCDYLVENTVEAAEKYAKGRPWTRVIWDVCAVGYLKGGERLMRADTREVLLPGYDHKYEVEPLPTSMRYVYEIYRDALFEDMIKTLTQGN